MSDILSDEDRVLLAKLEKALARLTPRRRNIFLLVRVERQTYEQVARAYGISEEQVRRHVYRAMWYLRRKTAPEDFTFWQRWWPF